MFTKIVSCVLVIASICLFLYLAVLHSTTFNTDINYPDQKPYVETAIKIKVENFWHLGDRNRMPIYPHIMSFFYSPGMSESEFFNVGKTINIALSLLCLLVIYKLASEYLKGINLTSFMLVTTFSLFVLKAAYFQVENLFYTLFFLTFLLFIKTIQKPTLKYGLLSGASAAIGYLTKGTMLLGYLIFATFLIGTAIYFLNKKSILKAKKYSSAFALSFLSFFVLTSPYLLQNKQIYGKYFYNTGTTFYVWYDSIHEAYLEKGTAKNGETLGWPTLSSEEIPSLGKYIKTHTPGQILQRLGIGFLRTILFMIWTYAVIPVSFLFILIFFLIFFVYIHKKKAIKLVKKRPELIFFTLLFFTSYILAFSWYAVVDSGPRFILTLFLPALFLIMMVMQKIAEKDDKYLKLFHTIVLLLILISLKVSVIPILKSVYVGF